MIKKLADRFFRWYCHPDYFEDIRGDLDELYSRRIQEVPVTKASWYYAWQVLLLFRPSIIRPVRGISFSNSGDMLKNYFQIGIRNLLKFKSNTAIHVFGLALGLAAFLLINQYVSFEKSYDTFHYHPDQLYRLTTDNVVEGQIQARDAMSFAPSGKVLAEELPEVLSYTTTYKMWRMILRKEDQLVEEKMVVAADSNFLNLFRYQVVEGDRESMLNIPNAIVLTQSKARKYFGNADPIGKTIYALGEFNRPFKVTGIIEDVPDNTHYKFDMLISLKSIQDRVNRDDWGNFTYYTYLLLDENTDIEQLRAKLPGLTKKYLSPETTLTFHVQPVKEIHLYSDFTYEPEIHGSVRAVNFLNIISIFILLIAWINYINLSTARAVDRAKEVGLRKVIGARKRQLFSQFLVESLLINFLGAVSAIFLAEALLPYFNDLVGKTVMTNVWSHPDFLKKLGLFFFLGTAIAGFYPALVLSSFRPIGVLKGHFGRSKHGALLRKGLVVFQFTASLALIASTLIVYQQVKYMTSRDMGIDINRVIGIQNPETNPEESQQFASKYKAFSEELAQLEGVEKVAGMSNLPGGGSADIASSTGRLKIVGHTDLISSTIYQTHITDQVIDALDVELLAGRNFNRDIAADTGAVIVNLSFLKTLNLHDPGSVIGEKLEMGSRRGRVQYEIIGVVNDYNRTSLKNNVEPTMFFHQEAPRNTLAKLRDASVTASINQIESTWQKFFPDTPFSYNFLDQRFEKLYQEEKKFGFLFANFAILAILVASLGLFGLASFLSVQRTKEVGVRKVLGASTGNIILLFFKDFVWLILIAVIIGIPLVYLSMNEWLSNYAFRIDFPWWVLALALGVVTLFAFLTVSYQTYKVAVLNPARTIRHE